MYDLIQAFVGCGTVVVLASLYFANKIHERMMGPPELEERVAQKRKALEYERSVLHTDGRSYHTSRLREIAIELSKLPPEDSDEE